MIAVELGGEWRLLPGEMQQGRSCFTPCGLASNVYLCGGSGATNVDVFNLRSGQFTGSLGVPLPLDGPTVSWVYGGYLIILSNQHRTRVALDDRKWETETHRLVNVNPGSNVLVSGRWVYWTSGDFCWKTEVNWGQFSTSQA